MTTCPRCKNQCFTTGQWFAHLQICYGGTSDDSRRVRRTNLQWNDLLETSKQNYESDQCVFCRVWRHCDHQFLTIHEVLCAAGRDSLLPPELPTLRSLMTSSATFRIPETLAIEIQRAFMDASVYLTQPRYEWLRDNIGLQQASRGRTITRQVLSVADDHGSLAQTHVDAPLADPLLEQSYAVTVQMATRKREKLATAKTDVVVRDSDKLTELRHRRDSFKILLSNKRWVDAYGRSTSPHSSVRKLMKRHATTFRGQVIMTTFMSTPMTVTVYGPIPTGPGIIRVSDGVEFRCFKTTPGHPNQMLPPTVMSWEQHIDLYVVFGSCDYVGKLFLEQNITNHRQLWYRNDASSVCTRIELQK